MEVYCFCHGKRKKMTQGELTGLYSCEDGDCTAYVEVTI